MTFRFSPWWATHPDKGPRSQILFGARNLRFRWQTLGQHRSAGRGMTDHGPCCGLYDLSLKKSSKWPQSVMSQAWTTQSNNLSVLLFGSFLFLLLQKSKMPRSSSSSIIHHVPISNSSSIAPEPPLVVTPSPCFLSFLSPGVQQQASPCFYPKSMYRENMILQLCTYTWTYIYIHIYTCTVHSVLGRLSRLINSMIICCALHGKSFCGSLLRMDTLVTLFVGA